MVKLSVVESGAWCVGKSAEFCLNSLPKTAGGDFHLSNLAAGSAGKNLLFHLLVASCFPFDYSDLKACVCKGRPCSCCFVDKLVIGPFQLYYLHKET